MVENDGRHGGERWNNDGTWWNMMEHDGTMVDNYGNMMEKRWTRSKNDGTMVENDGRHGGERWNNDGTWWNMMEHDETMVDNYGSMMEKRWNKIEK